MVIKKRVIAVEVQFCFQSQEEKYQKVSILLVTMGDVSWCLVFHFKILFLGTYEQDYNTLKKRTTLKTRNFLFLTQ